MQKEKGLAGLVPILAAELLTSVPMARVDA